MIALTAACGPVNTPHGRGPRATTAEMVAYSYDQIDQARAELNAGLETDDI
jgi:hypothetical protein